MTDEVYFTVIERWKKRMESDVTREEALGRLVRAGIMDEEGNFIDPYRDLEWYFADRNR